VRRVRHIVCAPAAALLLIGVAGCGDGDTAAVTTAPEEFTLTVSEVGFGPLTLDRLPPDPAAAAWAKLMLGEGLTVFGVDAGNPEVNALLQANGDGVDGSMIVLTTPALTAHTLLLWTKQPRATALRKGNAVTAVAPSAHEGDPARVQRLLDVLRADGWR